MLKAGMSIKQALSFQAVSSVLAYIGMAVGVAVGNISSAATWMFALAAGMFLYIALVDLVSSFIHLYPCIDPYWHSFLPPPPTPSILF